MVMQEKRQKQRLEELNEITISVIAGGKNLPKEKTVDIYSEDISVSGTKIRGNILFPVDTLLKIDLTLKALQKQITILGKVKWIKVVFEDKWYEAGVEFFNTPKAAVKKIEDYISWKQKSADTEAKDMPLWIMTEVNKEKAN
jgi:c-di-GMP-binding flagellar brake protein YcgR